jgi:hypothetical protein
MVFTYDHPATFQERCFQNTGSQNNRVKVSEQAMQNVCFRRKDTPLHAEQRTKCTPDRTGNSPMFGFGQNNTKEMTSSLDRAQKPILLLC